ncbi:hypothetical protein ACIGW1_31910 [Streptomyces sp. NPDC053780]|uniref:hypothetical protein n=1 Tax=unclassified Streptomyces TaxID=2593676 RepID=UPI0034332506
MSMLLIKGFYDVKGSQPDGHTVHFTADDPAEWGLVGGGLGRAVEHSAVGRAKLRLDGVDALETHYGLLASLRVEMTAVVRQARNAERGLWPSDVTTTGAKITGLASLRDDVVVLPKLIRRLVDYLQLGTMPLTCFPAFLAGVGDRFSVLSTGEWYLGLHRVVEVTNGQTVRMTHPPEDLLFEDS